MNYKQGYNLKVQPASMITHVRKVDNRDLMVFIVFGILLVIIAGFRLLGFDTDYHSYMSIVYDRDSSIKQDTEEIAFLFIIWINEILFDSNFEVFVFIFAVLGVFIKSYALLAYSKIPILSLILYVFSYFLLHEYIQIRTGVAAGFFLFALIDIVNGDVRRYFLKVFLAIMFHWSSVIIIPLYFIIRYIKMRVFYLLPFIGISLFLFVKNVDLGLIINRLFPADWLIDYYSVHSGHEEKITAFNLISISQLGFFVFASVLNLRRKENAIEYDSVLLKIFSVSLFLFFSLSSFQLPVIAFRVYEYLNIVLLLLVPSVVIQFKSKIFLSTLSVIYFMSYAFHLIANVQAIPDILAFFQSLY